MYRDWIIDNVNINSLEDYNNHFKKPLKIFMDRKHNVAQVVYDIGNIGGAEAVAINLAKLTSKYSHSYIISLQSKYLKNMNLTDIKYYSLSKAKGLILLNLISLVIFVRKNNINILHAHNLKPLLLSIFFLFLLKV